VYVSSFEPQRSPAWGSEIWRAVAPSGFPPGALVFTAAGEWLGIATIENGEPIIVPAAALLDLAAQLNQPRKPAGEFGLQVQHVDAKLGAEIGVPADSGVLVAWVDPRGVAADALVAGDVIEAVDGARTPTVFAWRVHSTRLAAGAKAALQVRRAGERHDITLIVPSAAPVRASTALGLTLTRAPGLGSRVTQVAMQTAADRAGLRAGDIVTRAGDHVDPAPAQVRRAFDDAPEGGAVLLAVTRGDMHRLLVLRR
jgi:S1-C subfamily serine protease